MKKKCYLILLILVAQAGFSQTVTGTYSTVPCNNDGVLDVTTTGLTPPIDYTYYMGASIITHTNINATTDQLVNIPMSNGGGITIHATDNLGNAWDWATYTPAFTFGPYGDNAICPSTMGTLNATQYSGGAGPFDFTWTDTLTLNTYIGNPAAAPIGVYDLLIVDQGSGCVLDMTDSIAAQISQTSSVTGTINSTTANCTNGTATVVGSGGIAPYTYSWMNGATGATITGLSQGVYQVDVFDAQGCQTNFPLAVFVSQSPVITVNTTVTDATCVQSDGALMAFGSGGVPPYTYAWSNGQTGFNAVNLTGGTTYTVVATDANGCFGATTEFVGVSTPITVTYTATPSDCNVATGSASITPVGGTPPYSTVWNTFPVVNGLTISNFLPGTYGFTVTDAVGCVRTGSAVIPTNSVINATASGSTVVCPLSTGSAWTNVSGTNPPFTYLWSNAATSSSISGVPLGGYSVQITDAVGCTVTKFATVNNASNMNIGGAVTPVSCIYHTDGAINSQVTGGTAPYTYSWTGGSTGPNISGLGTGNYWLTVTDANGCSKSKKFTVGNAASTDACYCTIEGTVFLDDNANCVLDGGEQGIDNIMVHCSGQGYKFTNANGYYSFQVPTGTYTITEQVNAYYPLQTCQATNTTVSVVASSGCTSTVDIANDMNIINDVKLTTFNAGSPPIPGNGYSQMAIVKNMGTVDENDIQMGYEHDGQLTYNSVSLPAFMQTGGPTHYSVQSGFTLLTPGDDEAIVLTYNTPTNIPIGTEISIHDSVASVAPIDVNWLLDYTPWNNVNHYKPVVIGSYDPNYKEVYPKGLGAEGFINSDVTEFDYTIHFQNEGTYYAQNIYIKDQLDSDLDWATLTPGYSEYPYTTTVSETGEITFTFANINLPWKASFGDALSSSFVNYSIRRKDGVPQGTEFTNYADIYFDYNDPITTNTVINTLDDGEFNSVEESEILEEPKQLTVDAYPVPAKDMITFKVGNVTTDQDVELYIVDLTGKVLKSQTLSVSPGTNYVSESVSELSTGNYLTRIQFEDGTVIVKKIVLL